MEVKQKSFKVKQNPQHVQEKDWQSNETNVEQNQLQNQKQKLN
jgi:hypothetical protein